MKRGLAAAGVAAATIGAVAFACSSSGPSPPPSPAPSACAAATKRALLFSKTQAYRHASIDAATGVIEQIACEGGVAIDATEDASVFTDDRLTPYDALVFLSSTVENDRLAPFAPADAADCPTPAPGAQRGAPNCFYKATIMTDEQKAAFERFVGRGGGFVGVHAANDGDYFWPFYRDMVGAMFVDHPGVPVPESATIVIEDPAHPATKGLPQPWVRAEEWYNLDRNPRDVARVLLTVDESTYPVGPKMCTRDHPLAWCRDFHGARVFYTALGHAQTAYDEPAVRSHLLGAIRWATGLDDGDCTPRAAPAELPSGNASCNGAPCFAGCACTNGACTDITSHDRLPPPNCGAVLCNTGCSCADASTNACTCP